MVKSNVRSVRRRQTNRRIQNAEYNRRQQLDTRAYKTKDHERAHAPKSGGLIPRVRVYARRVADFLRGLFTGRTAGTGIRGLDLRIPNIAGGKFGAKRNAGAKWLRSVFGESLKMVSTRDGRPV